jgi:hypothetical protein
MLSACTWSKFFASYWSAGFGTFFQVSTLASHWLEDYANFTPTAEENSANYSWCNTSNKQIRFYQYTLHNYIPFLAGMTKISS